MQRPKGVLLYSGGLDSLLAGKILIEQNVDLVGLYCILPFYPPDVNPQNLRAVTIADQIGIKLEFYRCSLDYLEMVKNPPHGYGKRINPCIDCKIFFLTQAARLMKRVGADFVATGEVVGQRPMSQLKHMLIHLEKEAELIGRLLRPLSAKLLKPTIPELEGLIDREQLYGISGRGRKVQMSLAEHFNIRDYSSPAGGCLFTDSNYAKRLSDLLGSHFIILPEHLYLLTLGRYFRINQNTKLLISRNEQEGKELLKYSMEADHFFIPDFKGPVALSIGSIDEKEMETVCSIISKYGNPNSNENEVKVYKKGEMITSFKSTVQIEDTLLNSFRI